METEIKMIFIEYPKCSTCIKAKKWLDNNGFSYIDRNIKEDNPTKEELNHYLNVSNVDIKKMFNTSGLLYKELNLKDKLPSMTLEEKIDILSSNGMLVKRPILVLDNDVLFGFKEKEWEEKLKNN